MLTFTDTHCHLIYNFYQDDIPDVIERAIEQNIVRILIPGTTLLDSREAIEICERYERIYAAVGVHPNDALSWNDDTLRELKELSQHPKVVAIGEIGLDYYRDHAPHDLQQKIFEQQLELAGDIEKPVIIHNRDASEDVWKYLEVWHQELQRKQSHLAENPGVMHAYADDLAYAQKVIKSGFMLGIGGPVTYKNAQARQAIVRDLPLESLLLETDAPFLSPQPHRGRRNEPSYISIIAEKIAELKNITTSQVADLTYRNSTQLFRWSSIS